MTMTCQQMSFIWLLLASSVALIVIPSLYRFIKWLFVRKSPNEYRKRGFEEHLFYIALFLLLSVWCLRYAVGYFMNIIPPDKDYISLYWWEEIFNSMSHALQTFSMDEDYTTYIAQGKEMMDMLTDGVWGWSFAYGLYASVLNFLAPIVGGVFIFEMLASVFPRIKLTMSFWRTRYYFSKLNQGSLALVESMRKKDRRPLVIFTDAYVDDENEKSSELLVKAKHLGAICIKDDLSHVTKSGWGKRSYFLMSENENENLQELVDLSNNYNRNYIKKSRIHVFLQSDVFSQVEKQVRSSLKKDETKWTENDLPKLIPIQYYRNLATNLLVDIPLYEPLVLTKKKELNVTILGNGYIGTEIFLAVYWMGQMLDHKLNINIVSQDDEDTFRQKIDYINPEILRTGEVNDSLLRCNVKGDYSDPYFTLNYIHANIKHGELWKMDGEKTKKLLDTDYFVVALGSDEDNLSVADSIRRSIGEKHIESKGNKRTVIAYAIYDTDMCKTLNHTRCNCSVKEGSPDIYMHAFGGLGEVYSYDNIFMNNHRISAEETGEEYNNVKRQRADVEEAYVDRGKSLSDDYNFWANIARAMHLKYKVYSLGWIKTSIFDDDNEDKSLHKKEVSDACARYKRGVISVQIGREPQEPEMREKQHELAWLEHRRWNAFSRTRGYKSTSEFETYYEVKKNHKHMDLKLHPCLVECNKVGIINDLQTKGCNAGTDLLDVFSYKLYKYKKSKSDGAKFSDYKEYDYPWHEFPEHITREKAAEILGCSVKKIKKYCKQEKLKQYVLDENTDPLVIKDAVEKMKEKKEKQS